MIEAPQDDAAVDRFFARLRESAEAGGLSKLVLAKPRAAEPGLNRISVRSLDLRGELHLSFVYSHATRDLTKNLPLPEALAVLRELVGVAFSHAHLFTADEELQLLVSKKGRQSLRRVALAGASSAQAPGAHDREKHRYIDIAKPFLTELGVTDAQHRLIPAMARKWKQINKFIEVLDHALDASGLKQAERVRVADFGSGKGYLTFAVHDHLHHTLGLPAQVTGYELREDMVRLCEDAARSLALDGLGFRQGDVRSVTPQPTDVMIALHACDIATDYAMHMGIRAGASVIMCSPCCHKQIRPQLMIPHPLRPMLQHGIHLGQQAEMVTDGLRALLLEAHGYDTQVFEFVSLEHTSKNKMILAVKRQRPRPAEAVLAQVREIKAFYGIREQALESLLGNDGAA